MANTDFWTSITYIYNSKEWDRFLFSHSMGMILWVFVNELFGRKNLGVGNHSRDLWEHNQNSLGTNPM